MHIRYNCAYLNFKCGICTNTALKEGGGAAAGSSLLLLSKGSSYIQLKCETGSNSFLQNKWKNFAIGNSDSDRSHEEALPLFESFFFNNNTPGTLIWDDPSEITP